MSKRNVVRTPARKRLLAKLWSQAFGYSVIIPTLIIAAAVVNTNSSDWSDDLPIACFIHFLTFLVGALSFIWGTIIVADVVTGKLPVQSNDPIINREILAEPSTNQDGRINVFEVVTHKYGRRYRNSGLVQFNAETEAEQALDYVAQWRSKAEDKIEQDGTASQLSSIINNGTEKNL